MIFYLLTVFLRYEEQSLYTGQELLYDANAKEGHNSLNYNDLYFHFKHSVDSVLTKHLFQCNKP